MTEPTRVRFPVAPEELERRWAAVRVGMEAAGHDLVERPLIRDDETMPVAAGQLLALHPMYVHAGMFHWLCDNVMIGPQGSGPPLHGVQQRIFEVTCAS
jgi:hypothetical protein